MQSGIRDSGVFPHSSSYNALRNGPLGLPQRNELPGNHMHVPYELVADDAFLLPIL